MNNLQSISFNVLQQFKSKSPQIHPLKSFYTYIVNTIDKTKSYKDIDIKAVYLDRKLYKGLTSLVELWYSSIYKFDKITAKIHAKEDMIKLGPNIGNNMGIYVDKQNLFVR